MSNKRMPRDRWEYIKNLRQDFGEYIVGGWAKLGRTIVTRATQARRVKEGRKALAKTHEVDAGY